MGNATDKDLTDEDIEEFRMISGFDVTEIKRIRKAFFRYSNNQDYISKSTFTTIPCISLNPLQDKICKLFGYDDGMDRLNFKEFLIGLSMFNSPGSREMKLKVAFQMQDIDGDGVVSRDDLFKYIERTTSSISADGLKRAINEQDIQYVVDRVFAESATENNGEAISYADFQRVVAPLDFQSKLYLPI